MKVKENYMVVVVQVRKDHVNKLDQMGAEKGLPRSALVREAITNYIGSREATA